MSAPLYIAYAIYGDTCIVTGGDGEDVPIGGEKPKGIYIWPMRGGT